MAECGVCHTELEGESACSMCQFMEVERYREEHPAFVFCSAKEVLHEIERVRREGIEG